MPAQGGPCPAEERRSVAVAEVSRAFAEAFGTGQLEIMNRTRGVS